jgi:hypothetical protein
MFGLWLLAVTLVFFQGRFLYIRSVLFIIIIIIIIIIITIRFRVSNLQLNYIICNCMSLEELEDVYQSIQLFNHHFNMQKLLKQQLVSARLTRFKLQNIFP